MHIKFPQDIFANGAILVLTAPFCHVVSLLYMLYCCTVQLAMVYTGL